MVLVSRRVDFDEIYKHHVLFVLTRAGTSLVTLLPLYFGVQYDLTLYA